MKTSTLFAVCASIFLIVGCDMVGGLDERPPHLISAETLYRNLAGFETGVNGLYALIREETSGPNPSRHAYWSVGTDNMVVNYHTGSGFWGIAQDWGSLNNPSHGGYSDIFTWFYRTINAANTIISRADADGVDWSGHGRSEEENRNRILAEARAIRAWAYRNLTYGWGDVPLNLEESLGSTIRTDWVRTPVEEVREQIIADLEFAEQHIPVEPSLRGRITKGAVQTYLAEMYILANNPQAAVQWADRAINTPEYQLVTSRYGVRADQPGVPFMDMFYEGNQNRSQGNTEALWVWQNELNVVGGGGHYRRVNQFSRYNTISVDDVTPLQLTVERGGRGIARQSATKWALDNYEAGDDRGSEYAIKWFFILRDAEENAPFAADNLPPGYAYGDTLWLDAESDITPETQFKPDVPYTRKWEAGANPINITDHFNYGDLIYMRLAETYLLKAEAQYLAGDAAGAAETLNVLRRRANTSEINAGQVDIDFILDERSRELLGEEDRRWTLLRTGRWLERTRMYNNNGGQNVTERDRLFPIPQSVIDANMTQPMTQNPGF